MVKTCPPQPTRRLRNKTKVQRPKQTAIVAQALFEEAAPGPNEVYLVTIAHPKEAKSKDGYPLKAPGSMTKQEVLDKFRWSCANPVYVDAKNIVAKPSVPLDKTGVWRELHAAAPGEVAQPHDHIAVKALRTFRFGPVQRSLLRNCGLASHWSRTHTGYWSTVRYLVKPSPKKPESSLDHSPVLWAHNGEHPDPLTLCNEPLTAGAIESRRLRADNTAAEAGKAPARIQEIDIWPVVVKNNIKNSADDQTAHLKLMEYAKKHCTLPMQQFLFKNRAHLPSLIDDVWRWEQVEQDLAVAQLTRTAAIHEAAKGKCVCSGLWLKHVLESFKLNGIPVEQLCQDVLEALTRGRSEDIPVIVLAGERGGEGKSLFLKALLALYGPTHVFTGRGPGSFPMLELPGKKVCFLDEWRFDQTVVSYAAQCLWYDGSIVPLARPQNILGASGHYQYQGTAPIFVTTKRVDLQRLAFYAADDPQTGAPRDANASMMYRRLKVYSYKTRIPKPPKGVQIKHCPHCFAELLLGYGTGNKGLIFV